MSVFSFPRRLLICEITRESSIADADVSIGVRRHQKECGSASVRGCDFAFQQDSCEAAVLPCSCFAWHFASTQLINSADTLRTHEANMRSAALLICLASGPQLRPKRCAFAPRILLFALATGAIIDAEPSRVHAARCRRTPGGHTLSYAHIRRTPAPLVRGAQQPHRNERPSTRSALARNASTVSTVPRAGANGHGYMTKPKSRQAEAFEANGWPNEVAECAAASSR